MCKLGKLGSLTAENRRLLENCLTVACSSRVLSFLLQLDLLLFLDLTCIVVFVSFALPMLTL